MENNDFIRYFTSGKCSSFSEFEKIATDHGIFFEKINNEVVVCYDGRGNWKNDSYDFYRCFFPDTDLKPSSFDLISNISELHKKFIKLRINEIYKNYGMPPMYNESITIKENAILLLNTLKLRFAILKDDIDFIKYVIKY